MNMGVSLMSGNNQKNIAEELNKTMADINDLLAKSSNLYKGDEEMSEQEQAPEQQAPEQEFAEGEQSPEAGQELEQAPEQQAPEAGQEGEQGSDEQWEAEMSQHAKEMSDEELDMMLQLLMAEKESRGASQEQAPEQQAPEAAQQEQEFPEEAQKSMKEDFAKLTKSIDSVLEKIGKVSADVENLKKKPAATVTKPAASNPRKVQVLEKSATSNGNKPVERLNKSETVEFLQNQIRQGSRIVTASDVADFTYANSQADVENLQKSLAKRGVEFPKL
jgi:hypothetical protein